MAYGKMKKGKKKKKKKNEVYDSIKGVIKELNDIKKYW